MVCMQTFGRAFSSSLSASLGAILSAPSSVLDQEVSSASQVSLAFAALASLSSAVLRHWTSPPLALRRVASSRDASLASPQIPMSMSLVSPSRRGLESIYWEERSHVATLTVFFWLFCAPCLNDVCFFGPVVDAVLGQAAEGSEAGAYGEHDVRLGDRLHRGLGALWR